MYRDFGVNPVNLTKPLEPLVAVGRRLAVATAEGLA